MSCPHCGSWAVRSDRSLAGRLVCGRCGQPLTGALPRSGGRRGNGRRGSGSRGNWSRGSGLQRLGMGWRGSLPRRRWGLLLLLLLTAAWLAAQPQPPRPGPDRPGLPPGGRPI